MGGKIKLVVPTNFSKKSEIALDFALTYVRDQQADVYLFHVLEAKGSDFRELDRQNVELMDRMKTHVLQAVERLHKQGLTPKVDNVHRRISHGRPGTEVLQIATGVNADVIVMGAPTSKLGDSTGVLEGL